MSNGRPQERWPRIKAQETDMKRITSFAAASAVGTLVALPALAGGPVVVAEEPVVAAPMAPVAMAPMPEASR